MLPLRRARPQATKKTLSAARATSSAQRDPPPSFRAQRLRSRPQVWEWKTAAPDPGVQPRASGSTRPPGPTSDLPRLEAELLALRPAAHPERWAPPTRQ